MSDQIRDSLFSQVSGIPTWKIVGWVFFNAHLVDTVVDLPFLGESTVNTVGGDGFTPLLFAVPVALLLIAGLATGRSSGLTDPSSAALAGAATTIGYGAFSVVGSVVFGTDNVAPELVTGVLLAGVVYPVVFGTLGGLGVALTAES